MLQHLTSYPLVSDSITTFKNNKYGAKSLTYADQGYAFAKPYQPSDSWERTRLVVTTALPLAT